MKMYSATIPSASTRTQATQTAPWALDRKVLDLAGQDWTIGDSFGGTTVSGGGNVDLLPVTDTLIAGMVGAGYGGVFFCDGRFEHEHIARVIRASGRGSDIVSVSLSRDFDDRLGHNAFAKIMGEPMASVVFPTEQLVDYLTDVILAYRGVGPCKEWRKEDHVMVGPLKDVLRAAVNLVGVAGAEVTFYSVHDVLRELVIPHEDRRWVTELFRRADWRWGGQRRGSIMGLSLEAVERFWREVLPTLLQEEPARSKFLRDCIEDFSWFVARLQQNPKLDSMLCHRADYSLADTYKKGSLILLDFSHPESDPGCCLKEVALSILLADAKRTALARPPGKDGEARPVVHYVGGEALRNFRPLIAALATVRPKGYALLAVDSGFWVSGSEKAIPQNTATWITGPNPDRKAKELFAIACSPDYPRNAWAFRSYLRQHHFDQLLYAHNNNGRAQTIVRTGKLFPDAPCGIIPEAGQIIEPQNFQFVEWGKPIPLEDRRKAADETPLSVPVAMPPLARKRGLFSRLFGGGNAVPRAAATPKVPHKKRDPFLT